MNNFSKYLSLLNNVHINIFLTQIDLEIVKSVLKTPVAPIIGVCSQFLFMPLVSLVLLLSLSKIIYKAQKKLFDWGFMAKKNRVVEILMFISQRSRPT